jgi:IS30 family transposase
MRSYSHLSDDEREQIGLLKVLGHSIGAIARAIRRPKSTISRELSRNRLPSGRYSPLHAAGAYQLRRRREALIEKDQALRSFVLDRLAEGWTPEQIAGWLKAGNERCLRAVGCETIYAFIYRAAQKAEQLWRYLTRRHNIEPTLRKSITFDNDTAFAQHARLKTMCAMTTWFCDAYASWQKGGVENANGRLRRWLPRQIDIDKVSDDEIQDIILTANLTPRKCLGFKTPFQAILKELGKDVQIQFS